MTETQPLKLVGFGNSAMVGASDYEEPNIIVGVINRVARRVKEITGREVQVTNWAWGGMELVHVYNTMIGPEATAAIQNADIIMWDGFGNDIRVSRKHFIECRNNLAATYYAATVYYDAIINHIKTNAKPGALVLNFTFFYAWIYEDYARRTCGRPNTNYYYIYPPIQKFNAECQRKSDEAGFKFINLIPLFNGPNANHDPRVERVVSEDEVIPPLTNIGDPLHPNTEGHKAMLEAFAANNFGGHVF